ncbi:MAG TPA: pimeloyl-ACP methyl ester esterase BioH [Burkholderiales bacterium]|nr:pimeloyl-ACP methyl ester esterase BioH [Burkholderiales bacterium]
MNIESFGRGPDLAMLHGWGMHSGVWRKEAQELARQFRVHLVDLPGHGKSRDCDHFDEVVYALAEQLPKALSVAGWSLGAIIALEWAAAFPEQVTKLAFIAGTPSFAMREDWRWGWSREVLESFEGDLKRNPDDSLKRFLSLLVKGENDERNNLRALRQFMFDADGPPLAALIAGLKVLKETDLRKSLPGIEQPALVMHGEEDRVVPIAAARWLAAQMPTAKLSVFVGCGHAPFLSQPEQFVAELTAFFDG